MTLTTIKKAGLDEIALDHVFTIGASGSSAYTFQGEGLNGTVNNPTLYLTRGKTYRFENGSGGHPFRIQSTTGTSGTAYNTGVTNNNTVGTVIVEVQHDAPDVLYYQCTSHSAMNGILYITGALADGNVTTAKLASNAVTTAKIADDAITTAKIADANVTTAHLAPNNVTTAKIAPDAIDSSRIADDQINSEHYVAGSIDTEHIADAQITTAKIADDAVNSAKIADGAINSASMLSDNLIQEGKIQNSAVSTAKIADQAVTLAKLPHGTSSNDGKFLRANNGADPTFETVTGTTINNNADNRVITGSGTANTLNAESGVLYDGTNFGIGKTPSRTLDVAGKIRSSDSVCFGDNSSTPSEGAAIHRPATSTLGFVTNDSERMRIDSSGRLGISHNLSGASDYNRLVVHNQHSGSCWMQLTSTASGNGINTDGLAIGLNTANTGHIWLRENADLAFATNGTKRMSILAGGGLAFNNDTATANALDDYEEGSWTPVANISGVGSVSSATCRYTKIGRLVHITARFTPSGSHGGSNLLIGGLPFTSGSSNQTSFSIMHDGFDEGGSQEPELHGYVGQGTNNISFYYTRTNGAGWTTVTGSEAVTHEVIFEFTYFTDS